MTEAAYAFATLGDPMHTTRTAIVRWSSTTLAAGGWGGVVYLGVTLGEAAGINTWFIGCATLAAAATMVSSQWWRMPSQADMQNQQALYALAYRDGLSCGACPLRPAPSERGLKLMR